MCRHMMGMIMPCQLSAGTVRVQAAAAKRDPTQRIVVTGMGCASVFGNDCDTFYSK